MGFFDSLTEGPKISGQERERCLAYYREELRLAQSQEREADLNNNALVKFGTDVMSDRRAAQEYRPTVNRLAGAARAILERRNRMAAVPDAAGEIFFAWQSSLLKYPEWASEAARYVDANPWEPGQKLWATSGVREVPEAGTIYCTKCGRKNDSQANCCRDRGASLR